MPTKSKLHHDSNTSVKYSPPIYSVLFALTLTLTLFLFLAPKLFAAEITVNTTTDENGATVDTQSCSLREAIHAINISSDYGGCINTSGDAYRTNDRIVLPPGFYEVSQPYDNTLGSNATNTISGGDLNIRRDMSIHGAGPDKTAISGRLLYAPSNERLITFSGSATDALIEGITLGSRVFDGTTGALIHNGAGGLVEFRNTILRDAVSTRDTGGPIVNTGASGAIRTLRISNSTILSIYGANTSAIYNKNATRTVELIDVTITSTTNGASADPHPTGASGVLRNIGTAKLTNVTIVNNRYGLFTDANATTYITSTLLALNGDPSTGQNCRGNGTYVDGGGNLSDDTTCPGATVDATLGEQLTDITVKNGQITLPALPGTAADGSGAPNLLGLRSAQLANHTVPEFVPELVPNAIRGTVYRDFNGDSQQNGREPPVSNITVNAYFDEQTLSTITDATGVYTLALPITTSTPVRIEFTDIPTYLKPSPFGAESGTTTQFVDLTAAGLNNVHLGLSNPKQHCQDSPDLATSCFLVGDQSDHVDRDVLISFPYDSGANSRTDGSVSGEAGLGNPSGPYPYDQPAHKTLATGNTIGSTWGLAYQRTMASWFAAAFIKRHAGLGPLSGESTGAIYEIAPDGSTSVLLDLNQTFGPTTAGTNPHDGVDYAVDRAAYEAVGKVSLGDMDISEDDRTLYVINLVERNLYAIPIDNPATAAAIPLPVDLPNATLLCDDAANNVRPFALSAHQGRIYVGMVCSAESTQDSSQLSAFVYSLSSANPAALPQLELEFPLTYVHGNANNIDAFAIAGDWRPWNRLADVAAIVQIDGTNLRAAYPQPLFADIEFDIDETGKVAMIMTLMDRIGHQQGNAQPLADGSELVNNVEPAGDILRACQTDVGTWQLESNGQCGSVITAGINNGQGPGNGEYYFQDEMTNAHPENVAGGIAQVPGQPDVAFIVYDPVLWARDVNSAGVHWASNRYGTWQRGYRIYDTRPVGGDPDTFAKANGLGDLEAACTAAPIEIGNRVWHDIDRDGIQDPDEPPLAGVTVHLYAPNGGLIASATTAPDGTYLFSNSAGTSSDSARYNIATLTYSTDGFYLRVDQPDDYAATGALYNFVPTIPKADGSTDGALRDSDGVPNMVRGNYAEAQIDLGGPGQNNHNIDFGFYYAPPDLAIRKLDSPDPALAGATITYTVEYSELNGLELTNLSMTDTLPAEVRFLGQIDADPPVALEQADSSTLVWRVPTLPANSRGQIRFLARIADDFAGTFTNTITIGGPSEITPSNNTFVATTTVLGPTAELSISKFPQSQTVLLGDTANFTITVRNGSTAALRNLVVADPLTPDCQFTAALLPALGTIEYRCTHEDAFQDFVNSATVRGETILGTEISAQATAAVRVVAPGVEIQKLTNGVDADRAPGPYLPFGDNVAWSYVVTNSGNITLTNVRVADSQNVAVNCPLDTLLPAPGLGFAPGHTMTCSGEDLANPGQYANIGTVTADADIDGQILRVEASDPSHYFGTAPALTLRKLPLTQTIALGADAGGATATFLIAIENRGNVPLHNVAVSDPLAPNCNASDLSLGVGETLALSCQIENIVADLRNVATVTALSPISEAVQAQGEALVQVVLAPDENPSVAISKEAVEPSVAYGAVAPFDVVVENDGDVALTDVRVTDPQTPACDRTFATLAVGGRESYRCQIEAAQADLINVILVQATSPAGLTVSASDSAAVEVADPPVERAPHLTIAKEPSSQILAAGERATFTVTVRNDGNVDLADVLVADPQLVACNRTIATLAPGQSERYTCASEALYAGYKNMIFASVDDPSGAVSATASATVHLVPAASGEARLAIVKEPAEQTVALGDGAAFTITVQNAGTVELVDVDVSDLQTPACAHTIDRLPAGESITYRCVLTAVERPLVNVAIATAQSVLGNMIDLDSAAVNLSDSAGDPEAGVQIVKQGSGRTLLPQESAFFTITVINTGSVALANVAVDDLLTPACNLALGALPAGASVQYGCQQTDVERSFTNLARVVATLPDGSQIDDEAQAAVSVVDSATLGDRVWADLNRNGLQDAGEAGVGDVVVKLLDAEGALIAFALTDSAGVYTFSGLPAGTYAIEVLLPQGYAFTIQNLTGDAIAPEADSNIDPLTGRSGLIELMLGEAALSWDAGIFRNAQLILEKSDGGVRAGPGDSIVYSLAYANVGSNSVPNVVMTETVPMQTIFDSSRSTTGWSCADGSVAGTACAFAVGDLPPASTGTVTFGVLVVDTIDRADPVIRNAASIAQRGRPSLRSGPNIDVETTVVAAPTAIVLASFGAMRVTEGVLLHWQTWDEIDSFGFHLLRGRTEDVDDAMRITPDLLLATGPDSRYAFVDETSDANLAYVYWLEEVDIGENSTLYGPVGIGADQNGGRAIDERYRLFLPIAQ